jgi:hypothetical protein
MSEETKTSIQALKNPAPREQNMDVVTMGFGSLQSFELMQRAAKMLAYSTLVPVAYRSQKEIKEYGKVTGYEEQPSALPNCVVALNMAQRMGADPLMVMQNLYIVEGRPSWSSQFIIAAINSCGRYTPLRFQLSEQAEARPVEYMETKWTKGAGGKSEKQEVKRTISVANRTCIAWAIEKETGERLESPVISIDMAVAEGWLTKNGSKWQTMPEVMLRYRAAAFFGKLYAPELLMGLQTSEEAHDIIEMEAPAATPTSINTLRTPEPTTGKAPDSNVTDVEDTSATPTLEARWAKYDEVLAEYGEKEAENFMPKEPRNTPAATETVADTGLTFAKVADSMNKAKDLEVLDVAADLISGIEDLQQQDELRGIYKDCKKRLEAPAEPAKKPRTAAKPDPAMGME